MPLLRENVADIQNVKSSKVTDARKTLGETWLSNPINAYIPEKMRQQALAKMRVNNTINRVEGRINSVDRVNTGTTKTTVSIRPKTSWTYIDYLTTQVGNNLATQF